MVLEQIYSKKRETETEELLKEFGWIEHVAESGSVFKKTQSITAIIRRQIVRDALNKSVLWNQVNFQGQNRRDREFGKTFDRIVLSKGLQTITIICNMSGAGARYVVFRNGNAVPVKKIRSMEELGDFLVNEFR